MHMLCNPQIHKNWNVQVELVYSLQIKYNNMYITKIVANFVAKTTARIQHIQLYIYYVSLLQYRKSIVCAAIVHDEQNTST